MDSQQPDFEARGSTTVALRRRVDPESHGQPPAASADPLPDVGEIVVTARKRVETLDAVPQAITVYRRRRP